MSGTEPTDELAQRRSAVIARSEEWALRCEANGCPKTLAFPGLDDSEAEIAAWFVEAEKWAHSWSHSAKRHVTFCPLCGVGLGGRP